MLLEFFMNDDGFVDSRTIEGSPLLSTFLTNEIGSVAESASCWKVALEKGICNASFQTLISGNAHTIEIFGERATLSNEFAFDEEDIEIDGRTLLKLIDEWTNFIDHQERTTVML